MDTQNNNVKPFGQRVLVVKERLDAGGLKLTPIQEEDGLKNTGRIVAIGQVGFMNRMRGVKVGAKIHFRKFFICNDGMENPLVFVDVESITGIEND